MWVTLRIGARVGVLCAVVGAAVSQLQYLGITVPWGGVAAQPPGIGVALLPGADQGWKINIVPRNEEQDKLIEQAYSGELFPAASTGGEATSSSSLEGELALASDSAIGSSLSPSSLSTSSCCGGPKDGGLEHAKTDASGCSALPACDVRCHGDRVDLGTV
ncbi:MAG TPA: hypothetical protein DDW52_07100 [Planctomycetaceae bacterium]|nr:hypothetical protein [Planctomycetaceae bacterium]